MTREKLVEIMRHDISKKEFDRAGGFEEALVDRILAALEAERVGEVVIGTGDSFDLCIDGINDSRIVGKKGSLIFREDK